MRTVNFKWATLIVALVAWAEEQEMEGGEPTQVAITPERSSIRSRSPARLINC